MSNAIVPVVPKRNAVTGAGYPTSLVLGELAVNTTTGNVYLGADPGVVQIGIPVAAGTTLNLGTGDGSTVAFTITGGTGTDAGGYLVSVGGIDQPSGWTVAGTTLTFSEAPPAGAAVSVRAILKGEGGGGGGTDIGGRAWAAGATYTQGDLVATSQRETWICIQNANTGNDPATSPTWWAPQPADAVSLQLRAVAVTAPVTGQILAWRNSAWTPWGHMYAHSTYWSDDQTLINGSYLWTGNFTDAVAANVSFIEGDYIITTNENGIVSKAERNPWWVDTSGAQHVVSRNGSVTQIDEGGGVKSALFNNNGYLITTATASEFDLSSGDSTIEFWFKPTSTNFQYLLLGIETLAIHLWPNYELQINNGLGADAVINVALNVWQHVAVVISSDTKYVYLNGVLASTSYQMFGATSAFYIGSGDAYYSGAGYTGKITGIRIVKGTAIYTGNFSVPTSLLTAVSGTELLLNFEATAVPTV